MENACCQTLRFYGENLFVFPSPLRDNWTERSLVVCSQGSRVTGSVKLRSSSQVGDAQQPHPCLPHSAASLAARQWERGAAERHRTLLLSLMVPIKNCCQILFLLSSSQGKWGTKEMYR